MNKKLLVIGIVIVFIAVSLSGCNELFENENLETNNDNSNYETIEITSIGTTQTVNYLEKPVILIVDGMNCDITVAKETNLYKVENKWYEYNCKSL